MGLLDTLAQGTDNALKNMYGSRTQDLNAIKYNAGVREDQQQEIYSTRNEQKTATYKEMQAHLNEGTVPDYFKDKPEEFAEYAAGIERKVGIEGNFENSIAPSDIFKIRGGEHLTRYQNETDFMPTYLGEGKYLDGSTSYGTIEQPDGSETLGIIPQVATVDGKTGKIYSADATYNGENIADIFARGGAEEVDEKTIRGLPLDFIDQLDREYGIEVSRRGNVETGTRNLGPGPGATAGETQGSGMDTNISEGTRELLTEDERAIVFSRDATREEKGEVLRNAYERSQTRVSEIQGELGELDEQDATRAQFLKDNAGTTLPGTEGDGTFDLPGINMRTTPSSVSVTQGGGVSGQGPIIVPPNSQTQRFSAEEANEAISTLTNNVYMTNERSGTRTIDARLVQHYMPEYLKRPGENTIPFGYSEEVWNQMGVKGRANATNLEIEIDKINRAKATNDAETFLDNKFEQHRTETGSDTNIRDVANDTIVRNFYKSDAQGMSEIVETNFMGNPSDNTGKLMERFRAKPELYAEFRDDPYAFAMKYSDDKNGLYGLPVSSQENNAVLGAAKGADLDKAEKALVNGDRKALEAELAKVKTLSETQQKEIAAFNTTRGGDMFRYSKPVKTATVISYLSSLQKDHPFYEAIIGSPQTMATYLETGNWTLAGQELQQKVRSNNLKSTQLQQDWTKWVVDENQKFATSDYSAGAQTFHTAFMGQLQDVNGQWSQDIEDYTFAGQLIQDEVGRVATAMKKDPTMVLNPTLRNDYEGVMRKQAMLLKQQVALEAEPSWWQELFTLGFASGADPSILELNSDIIAYNEAGDIITDPTQVDSVSYFVETNSGNEISAASLDGDLGKQAVAALLWASRKPAGSE